MAAQRKGFVRELAHDFAEHRLLIYATSIGFRALICLVPVTLLAFGLLGALGLKQTWRNSIAPEVRPHVTPPVFDAIDYSAEKILTSGTAPLIVFAIVIFLWDLALAIAAIVDALNRIHEVQEKRSFVRRAVTMLALAVVTAVCLIGTVLILTVAPRVGGGAVQVLFGIGRWLVGAFLLMVVVGAVMRFGPAERPEKRWASIGSLLVIVVWIVVSLLFKLWVTRIADFKSAVGGLTVVVFLSWYVFVSSAIFLVGAQVDELLRREAHRAGSSRVLAAIQGRGGS